MAKKNDLNYEQALSEIKEIIAQLEQGDMDIDSMETKAKRAAQLISACKAKLKETDASIQQLLNNINA